MAWIESHAGLCSHPKTRKAAQILGIPRVHIIGHLHSLWHWALAYSEFGDLSDFDAIDLALAAEWEGDPKEFVDALINCGYGDSPGFIERDGPYGPPDDRQSGALVLHDWWDYAGKLVHRRWQDRQRKRQERADQAAARPTNPTDSPLDVQGTGDGRPTDAPRATGARAGTHADAPATVTVTHQTNQDRAAEPAQADDDFEDFWARYPRGPAGKPGGDGAKKPAKAKWIRLTQHERDACLAAVDNYRDYITRPDSPNAAYAITWLNQERWEQWQQPGRDPRDIDGDPNFVHRDDGLNAVIR